MTAVAGTKVASQLTVGDPAVSKYGTHYSFMGTGGYIEVLSLSDRNAIPVDLFLNSEGLSSGRRRLGMKVYVYDTDTTYILKIASWGTLNTAQKLTALGNNANWQIDTGATDLTDYYTKTDVQGLFDNGLTWNGTDKVQLGGDLVQNTELNLAGLFFSIIGNGSNPVFSATTNGVGLYAADGSTSLDSAIRGLYGANGDANLSWNYDNAIGIGSSGGFFNIIGSSATADRTNNIPDANGDIALLNDGLASSLVHTWSIDKIKTHVTSGLSGAVMLTGNQTIDGYKTFTNPVFTPSLRVSLTDTIIGTDYYEFKSEYVGGEEWFANSRLVDGTGEQVRMAQVKRSATDRNIVITIKSSWDGISSYDNELFKSDTNGDPSTWYGIDTTLFELERVFDHFAFDTNNYFIVGTSFEDVFIQKTTDNGLSWTRIDLETFTDRQIIITCITFRNSTEGYIAGYTVDPSLPTEPWPLLYKTTNGGTSWTNISSAVGLTLGSISCITIEGSFGVHIGGTKIESGFLYTSFLGFSTDNGGSFGIHEFSEYDGNGATSIKIKDNTYPSQPSSPLWATVEKSIYKSVNQGTDWTLVYTTPSLLSDVSFDDLGEQGFAVTTNGSMYKSVDGGENWYTYIMNGADPDYFKPDNFKVLITKNVGTGNYVGYVNAFSAYTGEYQVYVLADITSESTRSIVLKDSIGNLRNLQVGYPLQPSDAVTLSYLQYFVGTQISASNAIIFKGLINASSNPNYPAAELGHLYRISVAGKIGGASGINVEVGDSLYCITTSVAGNQATVGANWQIVQANIDGAVVGAASSVNNNFVTWNGTTGKLVKDSGINISLLSAFNGASQLVQLNGSTQYPALNGSLITSLNASNLASGTVSATLLPAFTATVKGVVNPPTTATGKYLKDDNTWFLLLDDTATTASTTKTWSANKISTYISGTVPTNGLQAVSAKIGLGGTLSQATTIDLNSRVFQIKQGATTRWDFSGGTIYYDNGNAFAVFGSDPAYLCDYNGLLALELSSRFLVDSTGSAGLDWENKVLAAGGSFTSLDWQNRVLKEASGSTTTLDWQNATLNHPATGAISVDWQNRILVNPSGLTTIVDWQYGNLNDPTTGYTTVDWGNTWLRNTSGNVVVNWGFTNGISIIKNSGFGFNINASNITGNHLAYLPDKNGTFALIEDMAVTRANVSFNLSITNDLVWGTYDIGDWTLTGNTTLNTISSPIKGLKRFVIVGGGYNFTISTSLIPVARVKGRYNPSATNYLTIICLSETTPEYTAEWFSTANVGAVTVSSNNIDWNAYTYQTIALSADTTVNTFTNLTIGEKMFKITGDYEFTINSSLIDPKKIVGRYIRGMTNYLVLRCIDTSTPELQATWQNPTPIYNRRIEFDTRSSLPIEYASSVTGTGASSFVDTSDSNTGFGVWFMSTGTTTTGRAAITTLDNLFLLGGTGVFVYETALKLSNALSDGTDTYRIAIGLLDTVTTTDVVDGVFFLYDTAGTTTGSAASANWQLVASNNSSRTFVTSSVAVVTGSYIKLRIEVSSGGAAIRYYINDVYAGTVTTSGSIPKTVGRETGEGCIIFKSAGTNSRGLKRDYSDFKFYAQ